MTGLSHHTIRAWERRYSALSPSRTGTNRRIYTDEDVERLVLLKSLISSGHTIGQVASLETSQLRVFTNPKRFRAAVALSTQAGIDPEEYLAACILGIESLDGEMVRENLVRGAATLGILGLLERVIIPLIEHVGEKWSDGSINIFQEHLSSAILKTFLDQSRFTLRSGPSAPVILITTPRNQLHELGALMVAIVAASYGWEVVYLGPNLPPNEVVKAVKHCQPNAVALSIVFPTDDRHLGADLAQIREGIGTQIPLICGGRACQHYQAELDSVGAIQPQNLWSLRDVLSSLAA